MLWCVSWANTQSPWTRSLWTRPESSLQEGSRRVLRQQRKCKSVTLSTEIFLFLSFPRESIEFLECWLTHTPPYIIDITHAFANMLFLCYHVIEFFCFLWLALPISVWNLSVPPLMCFSTFHSLMVFLFWVMCSHTLTFQTGPLSLLLLISLSVTP